MEKPPKSRKNVRRFQRSSLHSLARSVLDTPGSPGHRKEIFGFALRNFLDSFYTAPRQEKKSLLTSPPAPLRESLRDSGVADAYLAALADHLARESRFAAPAWAARRDRLPDKPWFALSSPEARMWLLTQSPAAFRERNLFISAEALSRA